MSKRLKSKVNKHKSKLTDNQYVPIPKIVYINKDLNFTDKLVLSWIHSFAKTWNNISTKTIAEKLGLTVATINKSIVKLVFLELIEERYYFARKRTFRSLLPKTNDAFSLVTTELLNDKSIPNTVKLTLGVIIAASLGKDNYIGGFNFTEMEILAERLGLSVSSVYRHLAYLRDHDYIERQYGSYLIKPLDSYSYNFHQNQAQQAILNESVKEYQEHKSNPVELDSMTIEYLDDLHSRL